LGVLPVDKNEAQRLKGKVSYYVSLMTSYSKEG